MWERGCYWWLVDNEILLKFVLIVKKVLDERMVGFFYSDFFIFRGGGFVMVK